jgi:circadian clock protein KaiC
MDLSNASAITADDPRAATGIPGLDELLRGGLPSGRLHLVEGDPGTGKTTLALQFLDQGRRNGEPCLYVTLSETAAELRAVARSHGLSLDGIDVFELAPPGVRPDNEYTLYHPAEIELADMIQRVLDSTARVNPRRVVLDSLSEMRLLARDPLRYRRQVLALKEYYAGRDCTVLMLDDKTSADRDLQLQSIAHSAILLEQLPAEFGRSRRRIRIVKVRGVPGIEGYHDFKIRRGGLSVFPQLVPPTGGYAQGILGSGLPEADALMGGGLAYGTCTLFIGPAGVGKSSLASQFVAAGAAHERAAIYLFDERRGTMVQRSDALGMRMSERIRDGRIWVDQIEPGELSPGEFAHRVCDRVNHDGCRVVLIDSINGYMNAISSVHAPLVRMHELIAYLNEKGVVTLVVAAQHGIIGTHMTLPIDVSYLADAVVLFRFFEAFGTVRKAISVVKRRTGVHETTIREYAVGPDRVRVGPPLTDFQGVLTGVPQYRGPGTPLLDQHDPQR